MSSLDASVYLLVIAYPPAFRSDGCFYGTDVLPAQGISRGLKKRDFLPAAVCGEGEKSFILYLCENNSLFRRQK